MRRNGAPISTPRTTCLTQTSMSTNGSNTPTIRGAGISADNVEIAVAQPTGRSSIWMKAGECLHLPSGMTSSKSMRIRALTRPARHPRSLASAHRSRRRSWTESSTSPRSLATQCSTSMEALAQPWSPLRSPDAAGLVSSSGGSAFTLRASASSTSPSAARSRCSTSAATSAATGRALRPARWSTTTTASSWSYSAPARSRLRPPARRSRRADGARRRDRRPGHEQ